jgi:hypothetical protein
MGQYSAARRGERLRSASPPATADNISTAASTLSGDSVRNGVGNLGDTLGLHCDPYHTRFGIARLLGFGNGDDLHDAIINEAGRSPADR